MTIGVFYRRYDDKLIRESKERNDDAIRDYLLTDPDKLGAISVTRPILWIPIVYTYNSRKWESFGSRSSYDLNQPYLYLVVKSIISYCKDSFHICLVDDNSYKRLMPDWGYEPNKTPEPVMEHARKLAMIRLLRIYGGMTVPSSFLCLRNLDELFHNSLTSNVDMFVCEEINNSSLSNSEYVTGISVMGCKQNSSSMKELELVYSQAIRKDFTMNLELSGEISNICDKLIKHGNVSRVNSELLGIRSRDEKRIGVEELLGNSHLDISTHAYGILIPSNDILKRTAYQWFARMSGEQVLSSNTIIGKYILVANVPSAEKAVKRDDAEKPEWISYWEVPSDAPVWGVKPNFLGNHVQARSFQATSSTSEEPAVSFSQ
uniref:Nucleotide-diphospho-sugar transferase domain-containing protein n=1 Tax=viral metagenome TaxID=1070528 RepID=A0A6C0IK05_9ZZZZ